jgi:hypothetical protein
VRVVGNTKCNKRMIWVGWYGWNVVGLYWSALYEQYKHKGKAGGIVRGRGSTKGKHVVGLIWLGV